MAGRDYNELLDGLMTSLTLKFTKTLLPGTQFIDYHDRIC